MPGNLSSLYFSHPELCRDFAAQFKDHHCLCFYYVHEVTGWLLKMNVQLEIGSLL